MRRKFIYANRVTHTAICKPACRMVDVVVWIDGDEHDHEIRPIVALEARTTACYVRRCRGEDDHVDEHGSHEEYLRAGYQFSRQEVETHPMFLDEDYGIISVNDDLVADCTNRAHRVCVADWPAGEDASRLADIVAQVAQEARRNQKLRSMAARQNNDAKA